MSQLLITNLGELATLKKVSGTHRESVVREAFKYLLKAWGRSLELTSLRRLQGQGDRPTDAVATVSARTMEITPAMLSAEH